MKRIIAIFFAIVMLVTAPMEMLASSGSKDSDAVVGGYIPPEMVKIDASKIKKSDIYQDELSEHMDLYTSTKSEWYDYATFYYYNQLTSAEKKIWNQFDAQAYKLLTSKKDCGEHMGMVKCGKMSYYDAFYILRKFRLSNPQYFFLNTTAYYSTISGEVYVGLGVYEKFQDGDERATATKKIKKLADAWEEKARKYETEEEQVMALHDLIVEWTDYNDGILHDDGKITIEEDEYAFSQSVYSVFCTDLTVCAGYAEALQMMCNAVGIDSLCVTSKDHQWNKIRINDSWYNVDPTWADGSDIIYSYFARSDKTYANASRPQSHKEEDFWKEYLPKCTLDASVVILDGKKIMTFPTIKSTTKAPTITVKASGSKYKVTIKNNTKNATIYYTTDGTVPTPGRTKVSIYKKAFTVEKGKTIKAIAVYNAKWDSDIVVKRAGSNTSYTIKFNANGGKGTMSSLKNRKFLSSYTLPANKFTKSGYMFVGWNTKKDGKGTSYSDKEVVQGLTTKKNGTVTLYAQWKKPKYNITYKLNGGVNHSSNPATYTPTTATITLKSPTREGYGFVGWYKDSKFKTKVTKITKGSTGNLTLYAKWEDFKYNVAYDGNGATSGTVNAQNDIAYGEVFYLAWNGYQREGYNFSGWNTKADGTGITYRQNKHVKNLTDKHNETVTLYAQWSPARYKIEYVLYGGNNDHGNPKKYTINTETFTLKEPTHPEYKFLGWYRDAGFTEKVTEIPTGTWGNIELYARWDWWNNN